MDVRSRTQWPNITQPQFKGWFAALGIASCVAAVAITLGGCGAGDIKKREPVYLETVNTAGESPWTSPLTTTRLSADSASLPPGVHTLDVTRVVSGDQAGLYGGQADVAVCDRDRMVTSLDEDPAKTAAFREVTGASDIREFSNTLSPVVLTKDARVTNYGYKNGTAYSYQSVLERGTAVFIDQHGVPRVRCESGSPLTEPDGNIQPQFAGTPWTNFNQDNVVTIQKTAKPVEQVQLVPLAAPGQSLPPPNVVPPVIVIVVGQPVPVVAPPPGTGPTPTGSTGPTPTGSTGPTPTGPLPTGPTPTAVVPTGPTPTGSTGPTPTGSTGPTPTGSTGPTPTAVVPTGPTPTGPLPTGSTPTAVVPTGSTPTAPLPTAIKNTGG